MNEEAVVILGAGGHARETFWHVRDIKGSDCDIFFVDDVSSLTEISFRNLPGSFKVIKDWNFKDLIAKFQKVGFVVGVSDPKIKEVMVERACEAGIDPLETLVHPTSIVQGADCDLGRGGLIAPGCILTTNVKLEDYIIVNYNCSIGHDAHIKKFSTVNPCSHVSGNVTLGCGVTVGACSFIREKIEIADGVVIGGQACVVKDVQTSGDLVVGVPAKSLKAK
ncbi:MAG: hypothetical protein CMJ16_00720 [Peredibacter sp.]|nr:hypothetical protein [Peredibacter sp.]